MTTPPDPRKSVVLRLSADQSSGANIVFPERCITLHGDKDTVTIGRASKSTDKGFIASAGNAWFHSPVMSRLHARLSANMDDRKIEIKDLDSLHGTFLNGDQSISGDESVELRQGDVLRFGAPIWRGSEQFFPATVKVDFQFSIPDGGASTFQVPDESDEDLDDSHSDDSVEMITPDGPNIMAHNISAQNAARAENLVIDLTGATTVHPPRLGFGASTPRNSQIHLHDAREPASFVKGQVETADDVIYDLSTNYELGDSVADANLGDRTLLSDDMTDLESNGSPNMDVDHAWYGADEQDDDDQDGEHDELDIMSEQTDDDSQIDYPDEESASQMDSFDEGVSDEDLASVGDDLDSVSIDDDMQENINVAGRYAHTLDASNASDDGSLGLGSRNDFTSWEEPSHFPRAPDFPEIARLVDSMSSPRPPPTQTVPGANTVASIDWLLNSDKPTPALNQEQMTPPDSSPATKRADVLGARTGKIDYFRAREENKMALEAQKAECSRPTSVQDLCNENEATSNLGMPTPEPYPPTSSSISSSGRNLFGPTDFRPILEGPPYEPHPTASLVGLGGEVYGCSRRTHVGIADIVNAAQQDAIGGLEQIAGTETDGKGVDRKAKRKAEDISDTTDAEERWAGSVSKMPSPGPSVDEMNTHPEPPAEVVQELIKPTDHDNGHPTTGDSQTQERPVKRARMMRVAERLGYAALGGVTAGAMIVGTLIYTAPTFG